MTSTSLSHDSFWLEKQSNASLSRLLPRLQGKYSDKCKEADWQTFVQRLHIHFPRLFNILHQLYGKQYDFFFHLEGILDTAARMWLERPDDLKALDARREFDPRWFQSNRMVGATCYVDLFADNLEGLRKKIHYFSEVGVTYLHLMPLFKTPDGDDDGGYAISSYREVEPELGTMEELTQLATELRHHGISLALDFVFNHTSDQHEWAQRALAGDPDYQEYYRMFPDRKMPDRFEQTMRAIFPDEHPGSFTYRNRIKKWVWTTFHNYQWDLNYENPLVFNAMAGEMLFLANIGVEVLRLDAVAFLWKREGTSCENLPEAHLLIQAFNSVVRIAAPAMQFKSEAIVHPDEVIKYISSHECQLSYNPQLMALLWNSLATREVTMLKHAMRKRFSVPDNCAWVNYIRCHDDIGWGFSDEDALEMGLVPKDHRKFLTDFFTGRFPGSFARGLPFQEDPETGDARISGTAASLVGLEKALAENDEQEREFAIRRLLLMQGVIITLGGIPLIYVGDEIGMLNDYSYDSDIEKTGDSRWVHRPAFDWKKAEKRRDSQSVEGRIYLGLLQLIQIRRQNLAFSGSETDFIDTENNHVLGYFRQYEGQSVLVLANFKETSEEISAKRLRHLGFRKTCTDLVAGRTMTATKTLTLEPYQLMILVSMH